MAKKQHTDPKQQTLARIRRTEAYAEQVRTLFAATVNEILALNKTMPTLGDGEMFSFDAESTKKQKEVERLLRQLHSVATMAIERGVRLEWAAANEECDKLVRSCFGKKVLESPEFTAWTQRNGAARDAFIRRSDRGLNLSQRVWKSCRQLRDEMEVAITVAVGEGTSAASMSRSVRKYLNDPDLMFRRFRYKIGDEEIKDEDGNVIGTRSVYGRKWKKRIRKPDGTVGWIDYDKDSYHDEWTGPGYYKSSAQNAMRVARTETNIAYRRADHERWTQMDFVLGQRVQMSKNHPKEDICDKLAGDYPKDFVFDGWHPQCFCFVTPILIDEDEMQKVVEAQMRGETYTPRGKRITQYPENFMQWVSENADNIAAARERGTEPYFIRNNGAAIDNILNPKKQLTPLEIAEQRHANRTPEQEDAIKTRWAEREARIEAQKQEEEAERLRVERIHTTANNVLDTVTRRGFDTLGIDTTELQDAIKSGDADAIKAQTRTLALAMSAKQKLIQATAKNVKNVAANWNEVDVSPISDAVKLGNLADIQKATRAVAQNIVAMKQAEAALETTIPNAHLWHQQFSLADLQAAQTAIDAKLAKLSGLPLAEQVKKIEFEIKWVTDPNFTVPHTQHSTWKVAQAAYMKKLDEVKSKQQLEALNAELKVLKTYLLAHPKATALLSLVHIAEAQIASGNPLDATFTILEAQKKKTALEKAQARRDAKKNAAAAATGVFEQDDVRYGNGMDAPKKFDADSYTQKRKDKAVWCKTESESKRKFQALAQTHFDTATSDELEGQYQYTAGSGHMNRPLRGYVGSWKRKNFKGIGNVDLNHEHSRASRRVKALTELLDRCYYDFDVWLQRGVDNAGLQGFLGLLYKDENQLPLEADVRAMIGRTVIDTAFMSCGSCKGSGFTGNILNIYCPKGTRMLYLEGHSRFDNCGENETLIQRNTHYRVIKVEKAGYRYYIDLEVVAQI